jgi:DNA-binding protein YbaB
MATFAVSPTSAQTKDATSHSSLANCAQAAEIVTSEAGAGLVKVSFTAQGKMTALSVDAALMSPEKLQVVEDLTVRFLKLHACATCALNRHCFYLQLTAVNSAIEKASDGGLFALR